MFEKLTSVQKRFLLKLILMKLILFIFFTPIQVYSLTDPIPIPKPIFCCGTWDDQGNCIGTLMSPEEYQRSCRREASSGLTMPIVPRGLSTEQQITLMMMQNIFQPLFNAMFQNLFSPPDTLKNQQELIRQQEEEKRRQEEMKRQALEAWQKILKEMEAEMARQEVQRKEAGRQILEQSRIGEDIKLEPSLFGTYQPKLEIGSISSISTFSYPAPESEIDKARCAAYFSKQARNTKDPEGARFLSLQAEKVMQGMPTDYPCQFEEMPETPSPQKSYGKNEEVKAFINTYQAKLKEFEEIQTKINEVRRQKLEAETRLKEADTKINELQTKSAAISKPEEKAQIDDLLSQAMAAKQEAENDLNRAKENEQKLLETAKQKADEIKSINDQISALGGRK